MARGARKGELEKKGLVLRHYLQYKRTVDYVQDAVGTFWRQAITAKMQWGLR